MIGKQAYKNINQMLNDELKQKGVLIAVHRGSSTGNIIENTIPAYLASLKMGGDIIEADVVCSKDRELYHFHSGMEQKNFQKQFDIKQCTTKEIENLQYINDNLESTQYPVEKLYSTLQYFKDRCLINIDRAWDYFPRVCEVINQTKTEKQVLLKGPLTDSIVHFFQKEETKFMFMPKIQTMEDYQKAISIEDMNIVGFEIKVETESDDFFLEENIQTIKNQGYFVWVNALTMDDKKKLFAGYDDNTSIIHEAARGWGVIFDKEADIIQTDWPSLLSVYRKTRKTMNDLD